MTDLIRRYVEAYNSGDVNTNNHMACASYLEGFLDADPAIPADAKARFHRCIFVLRGSANFIEYVRSQSTSDCGKT
jgi:hypothetical protein